MKFKRKNYGHNYTSVVSVTCPFCPSVRDGALKAWEAVERARERFNVMSRLERAQAREAISSIPLAWESVHEFYNALCMSSSKFDKHYRSWFFEEYFRLAKLAELNHIWTMVAKVKVPDHLKQVHANIVGHFIQQGHTADSAVAAANKLCKGCDADGMSDTQAPTWRGESDTRDD